MRIAYFYRDYLDGDAYGRPRATKCMARAMARTAERVFVYGYATDRTQAGSTRDDALTVRAFHVPRWSLARIFTVHPGLRDLLRQNRDNIDVVILTGGFIPENFPVAKLLVECGIPYVFEPHEAFHPNTFRGPKAIAKRGYELLRERYIVNHAVGVRLISDVQREHFDKPWYGHLRDDTFFVEKDGIDYEIMSRERQEHASGTMSATSRNELVFGFIGRFDIYQKGLDVLLHAWGRFNRRQPESRLMLVGMYPKSLSGYRLRFMCRRLGLRNVEILPPLYGEQKLAFMKRIGLLVHPSRHEIIPRVLREALGTGCPIMVTRHTNLHDLVQRHRAGIVVDLDPIDIADKLYAFSRAPDARQLLPHGALKAAEELDYPRIASDYCAHIEARLSLLSLRQCLSMAVST